MRFQHSSHLLFDAPAPEAGLRWPAWWLRLELGWTNHCIERLRLQLEDDFAIDALAPLYREIELLSQERDALVLRLASRDQN